MAKNIFLAGLSVFVLSCGVVKNDDDKTKSVLGHWVLIERSGGFAGKTTNFEQSQREKVLVLEGDKLILWDKEQNKTEQSYVIEKGKVIESSEPKNILIADQLMPQSIELKEGRLILKGQCYDCFTEIYQRLP